jgi:hypothetical protein
MLLGQERRGVCNGRRPYSIREGIAGSVSVKGTAGKIIALPAASQSSKDSALMPELMGSAAKTREELMNTKNRGP